MKIERKGLIKFKGREMTILGEDLHPGDEAPEFTVTTLDWFDTKCLDHTKGKVRIIAAMPSLETEVCDRETRRFNLEASNMDEGIVVVVISTDLPFTQNRWCGNAGIDRIVTLSDHMKGEFGKKYGCFIKEVAILRRAVFVVNRDNKITYSAYMSALADEPNYGEVLDAARSAL